jgi:CRP-like cAMP-binding protein
LSSLLEQNIARHVQLSERELDVFVSHLQKHSLKKKSFLVKAGDVCQYEAFVTKGCFRIFYTNEKGAEINLSFAFEDWWLTDIDSFTNQIPALLNIEAMEDSEVLLISKKDKDRLYEEVPKIDKLFRVMTQKTLIALQRRMIDNLSKTADERYLELIKRYPKLEQRIAQHHIASYLGISAEFLSKIRKKINQH